MRFAINNFILFIEKITCEYLSFYFYFNQDWVQDAIHERSRMNVLRSAAIENRSSWSTWLRLAYEAGQAWIVVSIVGCFLISYVLPYIKAYSH